MQHPAESQQAGANAGFPAFNAFESALELIALGGMLISVLIAAFNYSSLPAQIPVHFNGSGIPDRFGAKGEIWLIVGIVIVLCLTNWAIARFVHQLRGAAVPATTSSTQQLLLLRKLVLLLNTELALLFVIMMNQTVQAARGTVEKFDHSGMIGMLILMGLTVLVYLIAVVRTALSERPSPPA
jgi:uncharacterized membrane protein